MGHYLRQSENVYIYIQYNPQVHHQIYHQFLYVDVFSFVNFVDNTLALTTEPSAQVQLKNPGISWL